MTNTNKLKAAMLEANITQDDLAETLGLSRATISNKINNKTEFKVSEINQICHTLCLTNEQKEAIFFAQSVEK